MTLGDTQREFTYCVAQLILFAYGRGYKITFPPDNKSQVHMDNSNHYRSLAIDLNLFKHGTYLTQTEDHLELGTFWKTLNPLASWGGDFTNPDGNHYSFEWKGTR